MFKVIITALLVHLTLSSVAQVTQDTSLNGVWSFLPDKKNTGVANGFADGLPVSAKAVTVPHTWNIMQGLEEYYGTAWYQKKFVASSSWKGNQVYLKFGAVYHDAMVYVNGVKVGEHTNSGYTAFSFEISKYLKFGLANHIVVSVSNEFSDTNLPYKTAFDWPNDGGITRSVSLHVCGPEAIKYVHVTPQINFADSTGFAQVNIQLNDSTRRNAKFNLVLKEKKTGKLVYKGVRTGTAEGNRFAFNLNGGKVIPWHFDNPFLYELQVSVLYQEKVSDSRTTNFGYRTIAIKNNQLLLNNEPVRLPGIEYMPGGNPRYGAAGPYTYIDSVVHQMRNLNVVITRFHWQQDEEWLDKMDEAGILVQEEIPWWQQPVKLTPELMITAKKHLSEIIEAHYNHPSVFAWGLNNEVSSTKEDNTALKAFAQALDPTRMANVIGNKLDKKLTDDPSLTGDLPSWNEYVGTWNGNKREALPAKLDEITKILNGRPLFITEYGLCEPAFTGGDARRADDMFYHINEWRKWPGIVGFIYFCLNDYRTQMGEEGQGKFKVRRHGVADMYLKPKASLSIFNQICSPVEITKVVKANATDANVSITVKNTIPSYTIRNYTLEYRLHSGVLKKIKLKDIKPGDSASFVLKNINDNYAFKVFRSTGEVVAEY